MKNRQSRQAEEKRQEFHGELAELMEGSSQE